MHACADDLSMKACSVCVRFARLIALDICGLEHPGGVGALGADRVDAVEQGPVLFNGIGMSVSPESGMVRNVDSLVACAQLSISQHRGPCRHFRPSLQGVAAGAGATLLPR